MPKKSQTITLLIIILLILLCSPIGSLINFCGILMHNYGGLANCLTISTFGKQGVCVMRQCGPITHFITHLIFTRSVMWQRVYCEYVIKRMSIIVHYSFMGCVKVLLITIFFWQILAVITIYRPYQKKKKKKTMYRQTRIDE